VFVAPAALPDNRLNIPLLQILKTLLRTVLPVGCDRRGLADIFTVLLNYLRNSRRIINAAGGNADCGNNAAFGVRPNVCLISQNTSP
jgi:hypothetical protein